METVICESELFEVICLGFGFGFNVGLLYIINNIIVVL